MITSIFYYDGFVVQGHALSAPFGKDLVCASVSAIVFGGIAWFNPKQIMVNINDKQSWVKLVILKKNKTNQIALDVIKQQIINIANHYKKYLTIKNMENISLKSILCKERKKNEKHTKI